MLDGEAGRSSESTKDRNGLLRASRARWGCGQGPGRLRRTRGSSLRPRLSGGPCGTKPRESPRLRKWKEGRRGVEQIAPALGYAAVYPGQSSSGARGIRTRPSQEAQCQHQDRRLNSGHLESTHGSGMSQANRRPVQAIVARVGRSRLRSIYCDKPSQAFSCSRYSNASAALFFNACVVTTRSGQVPST